MKKRSLVIAILFSVFSHIYAENEWVTIASTKDKDTTCFDTAMTYWDEAQKITELLWFVTVNYQILDDGLQHQWACMVKENDNDKTLRFYLKNAFIDINFTKNKTKDAIMYVVGGVRVYPIWLAETIDNCITESKLMLEKHKQAYSNDELEGLSALKAMSLTWQFIEHANEAGDLVSLCSD
ncbi:hypothetical protein [Treponema sp.]|uniref:hypothetical protein n=1 Tax=Treponema sp. TaxID=166 RepID=UPI00257C9F52|nr:hypothetical protein [Treponema sp.]